MDDPRCLDWQEMGLLRPSTVVAATEEYFSNQDLFRQWLAEECDVEIANLSKFEMAMDLYNSWSGFAKRAGTEAGSLVAFGDQMVRLGFEKKRSGRGQTYRGIMIARRVQDQGNV